MERLTDNLQRKVDEVEIAWLAGFWDGEGSIGIRVQKYHPKGRHMYFAPYAQLVNTDIGTLDVVDDILTRLQVGHHISWPRTHKFQDTNPTRNYKPCWNVRIHGLKRCKALLIWLIPYLMTKKAVAMIVWEFIRSREANHYTQLPYTDYEISLVNKFRINGSKGLLTKELSSTSPNDYMQDTLVNSVKA